MKALTFTSLFPNNIRPNLGVFVKERLTSVARLDGLNVKVVAPVPYYPPMPFGWRRKFRLVSPTENIDGLEVHHPRYLMSPKVGMSLYGLLMFLSVLPTVKKIKQDFDFDIIDAHYVYPDGFAAVLLGRHFGRPVVVSARGSDINLYKDLAIIRRLLRYTLTEADGIVSVCKALKDEMAGLGIEQEKISVIPNGVDTDKFRPVDMSTARELLGLPEDKKIVLSVGNLVPLKGFDILIRSFRTLLSDMGVRDIFLLIVGEGSQKNELERLISSLGLQNHIRLAGTVPHAELYRWYSAADLFTLASSHEGWPNVLLEALACGTPVVATKVSGMPEIIRSDDVGILADRDERKMADAISAALKKDWDRNVITDYARSHTWRNAALSVSRLFESILDGGTNRPRESTCS